MKRFGLRFSHVQIIALGFLILIAIGTILLSLPAAVSSREAADFTTAFFTALSASTVTGFTIVNTAEYWSGFGHAVIFVLFQIGGLGVMTIATLFFMLMRRRVGLMQREVMVESLNSTQVGGIMRLINQLFRITAVAEISGALLLSVRFIPMYGVGKGLWYGLFHSVSAFCNAGFDLMGGAGNCGSMSLFADDWYVNIILMALIIVGGLGFLVLADIYHKGFKFRAFSLQTKLVLAVSGILIVGGTVLFMLFESNGIQRDMPIGERILTALFTSVTSRNAGFVTIPASSLSSGGMLLMMFLMFIGGSPGSTSGGVKTTTITIIFIHAFCAMRHENNANIFGRRIESNSINKAVAIICCNLGLVFIGSFLICALQPELELTRVLFEVVSGIGTAGISTGLIGQLCKPALYFMMGLMFLGRLGSVSFAMALLEKRATHKVQYPVEKITIG